MNWNEIDKGLRERHPQLGGVRDFLEWENPPYALPERCPTCRLSLKAFYSDVKTAVDYFVESEVSRAVNAVLDRIEAAYTSGYDSELYLEITKLREEYNLTDQE